jgi:hypothetical protein
MVRLGKYFLSAHADDEMQDDTLERADVVNAIRRGALAAKLTDDPRGTRYCVSGSALDGRDITVVCRFHETGELIIVTVYAKD